MGKSRVKIDIDSELYRRAVAVASSTGRRPDDVVDEALRSYLEGPADILKRLRPNEDLTDDEAMKLANEEVHKYRAAK